MSTTLYRKYRPQSWADLAGQEHVKAALAYEVSSGMIAHAYLFCGPRGVGKTSVARILARALNCTSRSKDGEPCGACEPCASIVESRALDVIEIDAASHRGIDSVRENVIENSRFAPAKLAYKVFIIDEVHMLTTEAFNALLKTLEEPPPKVIFVLATTEPQKVPATVMSRCQRFDFRRISPGGIVTRLRDLAKQEGKKVDDAVLEEIAAVADGGLRDAEGLLGQVLTAAVGKTVTLEDAAAVLPRSDRAGAVAFLSALFSRNASAAIDAIAARAENGADMEQFAVDSMTLCRRVLLASMSGDKSPADLDDASRAKLPEWLALADVRRTADVLERLIEARRQMRDCRPVQLPLELAAAKLCAGEGEKVKKRESGEVHSNIVRGASPVVSVKAEVTPKEVAPEKTFPLSHPTTPSLTSLPEIDPGIVTAKWQEFVLKAGETSASLTFLLSSARFDGVADGLVRIGFEYAFHRDKFNEPKNRSILNAAFAAVTGVSAVLEGVLLEKTSQVVHDAVDAPQAASMAPLASNDPLVAAFGGRVVT